MRPSTWVGLLVFIVVAAGIRAHSGSLRASSKVQAAPAATSAPALNTTSWSAIVAGRWEKNQDEAIQSAFREAEIKVGAHLQGRNQETVWAPEASYIREHLWKDLNVEEIPDKPAGEREALHPPGARRFVEERKQFPEQEQLGTMRKVYVKVSLTPQDYKAIQQQERRAVSQQRQILGAKVLGGVVALLGVLAGYFRMEEATKGYYTTMLRIAAVSLVAAVVAGLVLVA